MLFWTATAYPEGSDKECIQLSLPSFGPTVPGVAAPDAGTTKAVPETVRKLLY